MAEGTHVWLPDKKKGIIALPPPSELDDSLLLSFEDDGALGFEDSVNNGTGAADEKRAALRPSGKLDPEESRSMAKVRNYDLSLVEVSDPNDPFNPNKKKILVRRPSFGDRIRWATRSELVELGEPYSPSLKRAFARGI